MGKARTFTLEQVAAAGVVIPQRSVQLEALTIIAACEKPTWNRADVNAAGLTERNAPEFEYGGILDRQVSRETGVLIVLARFRSREIARAFWILDLGRVHPGLAAVGGAR